MKKTVSITNRWSVIRPIYVEPEGADYWLLPGQTFVLHANVTSEGGDFEVWDDDVGLSILQSKGMGYITVFS